MTGIHSLHDGSPRFLLYTAIVDYISNRGEQNCNFTVADIQSDITSTNGLKGLINAGHIIKVGKDAKHRNVYRLGSPIEKEAQP
jgi:hypothetical protein